MADVKGGPGSFSILYAYRALRVAEEWGFGLENLLCSLHPELW
jgi:hypothetical protein